MMGVKLLFKLTREPGVRQMGFPTVPSPSASGISPTFLGFLKCSMTFWLYNGFLFV